MNNNKFPSILGIHPEMTYNEINNVVSKNGCSIRQVKNYLSYWYILDSKYKKGYVCMFIFDTETENILKKFDIRSWKEFFGFDDEMTFIDLIDIFKNYFLQGYKFKMKECKDRVYFENKSWSILCHISYEFITYESKEGD